MIAGYMSTLRPLLTAPHRGRIDGTGVTAHASKKIFPPSSALRIMTLMSNEARRDSGRDEKKWGILGGSFDPVHNGHIQLAAAALAELSLSRVLLIPAGVPPHKLSRRMAPVEDRLSMLRLALPQDLPIWIDDVEIDRGGISYTFETLDGLRRSHPGKEFFFLIGSDSLGELATWRRIDRIARLVTFAVLQRGDAASLLTPPELLAALADTPLRTVVLAAKPLDVSSTGIRRAIARGDSIAGMVPAPVREYIEQKGLYR
jgi:nicotinate-nucleotide adenylyltransferase